MASTTIDVGVDGLPILTFLRAGVFWIFLYNADEDPGTFDAWSSPDGVTWSLAQTGPISPGWTNGSSGLSTDGGVATWDGANKVTLAYQAFDSGTFFSDNFLIDFDLVSQTWGAPYAGQTLRHGLGFGPFGIYRLSSGHLTVMYLDEGPADTPIKVQTWDGAAWSPLVDAGAGAEALPGFNPATVQFLYCTGVLDSSDVLHLVYMASSGSVPTWVNRFFYQELAPGNVLQNFQEFPGQSVANQDLFGLEPSPSPNLFISGGKLYWGIYRNDFTQFPTAQYPALYVGSPLINPTFVESGNLFAAIPANTEASANAPPYLTLDTITGQLYLTYSLSSSGTANVGSAISSNGFASVVNLQISDNTGNPGDSFFMLFTPASPYSVTGFVTDEGFSGPVQITSFSAPPPIVPSIKITLRGVKRVRCTPEDDFPATLEDAPRLPSVDRAV